MTNNDGYMDEIHSLRNQYQADICVLLVNTLDNNGYAASIGAEFNDAFYVVKTSAAVSNYSFPHELGHLFGCRHDSDTGTTPYAYAHGYNWYGKLPYSPNPRFYRTIMSTEDESKYMRVQYFSNPNVYDQLNNPMGTVNYNNCSGAIDVRASYIAGFEPYFTTSGTMNINEWWSGSVTVTGNVTIASGVRLNIEPGTLLYFASGASLIVNGTLNAVGSAPSGITFNRSGSTGTWGGIQFNSGSSGNLQYCTIQNASVGINCTNTGSASIQISNCLIQNNSSDGIYLYNSSPLITNNSILSNGSHGINCDTYSSPKINYNTVKWNTYSGLRCNNFSSPATALTYFGAGGNVIKENQQRGINTSYNCNVYFGSTGGGGSNSIFNNTNYEVSADYGCNVYAQYNWWGSYPPPPSEFYAYQSVIDNNYAISSDPNPGRSIAA